MIVTEMPLWVGDRLIGVTVGGEGSGCTGAEFVPLHIFEMLERKEKDTVSCTQDLIYHSKILCSEASN
jgi:hypothetical protein